MAKYNDIFGQYTQYLSSDPANVVEGQVWYNSTSNTLKARGYASGSWASGASTNVGRGFMGGASSGTQNSALGYGGDTGPSRVGNTEEYSGASWSNEPGMGTGRSALGSCGTQTAGLGWCGYSGGGLTNVEEYNGSSWSSQPSYTGSARYFDGGGVGTSSAALSFGDNSGSEVYEYNAPTWSSQTSTPSAMGYGGGFGSQSSAMVTGGSVGLTTSYTYNGASWASAPSINNGRQRFGHAGANDSSGVIWGGSNDPGSDVEITSTEDWNGTSWTASAPLSYKRDSIANGNGTASAALNYFGLIRLEPNPTGTENYTGPGVATQTISTT